MMNTIIFLKHTVIITVLFVVTGIGTCGGYTEFKFDSMSGQYPEFMKPMKENILKERQDAAEKVRNDISLESYKILVESLNDFDKTVVEVFLSDKKPIFSLTINKMKSDNTPEKEKIQKFVKSILKYGNDYQAEVNYSEQLIDGHVFNRVDIKPVYGEENLTQSYLVNIQNEARFTILILAEGKSYDVEIEKFLGKLRFKK